MPTFHEFVVLIFIYYSDFKMLTVLAYLIGQLAPCLDNNISVSQISLYLQCSHSNGLAYV